MTLARLSARHAIVFKTQGRLPEEHPSQGNPISHDFWRGHIVRNNRYRLSVEDNMLLLCSPRILYCLKYSGPEHARVLVSGRLESAAALL